VYLLMTYPDSVGSFIEEVLRARPSLRYILQVTTRNVELHGVKITAGSPIRLLLARQIANRSADGWHSERVWPRGVAANRHLPVS
jgi:cytochrome P450